MTEYDMTMERAKVTEYVRVLGLDALLAALNLLGDRDLYSVSTEWQWVPGVAVIKARGSRGDLLIRLT
jgi:hypothetical protein